MGRKRPRGIVIRTVQNRMGMTPPRRRITPVRIGTGIMDDRVPVSGGRIRTKSPEVGIDSHGYRLIGGGLIAGDGHPPYKNGTCQ